MTSTNQERILHLIDFLAEYDALTSPPVRDASSYGIFLLRAADLPTSRGISLKPGAETWLVVDFLELPKPPAVPGAFVRFVGPSSELSPDERPVIELPNDPLDDDLIDAEGAEQWVNESWAPWAADFREVRRTKRQYRELFELKERLSADRDSIELVLGFGRLRLATGQSDPVDHPLLTIPVELEVDEISNQLTARTTGSVALETMCLSGLSLSDAAGITALKASLDVSEEAVDFWDLDTTTDIVRRIVRAVDQNGSVGDDGARIPGCAHAELGWTLFVRRRRPNYQGFLDQMRGLYVDGVEAPVSIQAIVADPFSHDHDNEGGVRADEPFDSTVDEPFLLPLPANEEQQRILQLARTRPGITVQGPPGTGKSHTIANLVSHYVAYGQRVLVVAEKEQALRVLADKIPAGIRDLTVSVLGADDDSRRRMGASITEIQARVTGINPRQSAQEIERLTQELDDIDRAISAATTALLQSRAAEVSVLPGAWPPGHSPTPSQAAHWVAEQCGALDYIDDEIAPDIPLPIAPAELAELVSLIRSVGTDRSDACLLSLPALDSLPSGAELSTLFQELDVLSAAMDSVSSDVTDWGLLDQAHQQVVTGLLDEVRSETQRLRAARGTWIDALGGQVADPLLRQTWQAFFDEVSAEREQLITIGIELAAHNILIPSNSPPLFEQQLIEARGRLEIKGRLGPFDKAAKQAISQCIIDSRVPSTPGDVELVLRALRQDRLRQQLATRWSNTMTKVNGPELVQNAPEDAIGPLVTQIAEVLAWPTRRADLVVALRAIGLSTPHEPDTAELARLAEVIEVCLKRPAQLRATLRLTSLGGDLTSGQGASDASPLWRELNECLATRHTAQWDAAREQVRDLGALAPQARRLRDLSAQMRRAAPVWTSRVLADPDAAHNPVDVETAWQWRQLDLWVKHVCSGPDPGTLQTQLERSNARRLMVIEQLVSQRAWSRLAANLRDHHKQALSAYVQAVTQFGKTGGKYRERRARVLREALDSCKDAVPVWIMPSSRALMSFRPTEIPPFDVLIIDEASQTGFESLPLLALASKAIIVGDDKQTSPEKVGVVHERLFELVDRFLKPIPTHDTLFQMNSSLYDVATVKFSAKVMLKEHFRCLPQIIAFSNRIAYDERIIPLRDQGPSEDWIPLRHVSVPDGYRNGDINRPEAEAAADLIEKMCADPAYDGMDFGVISLVGSSQSKVISDLLFERLGPRVFRERRILCGEPSNFQGDERDVMVICTVSAHDPTNPTGRIGALADLKAQRRINVAASRAKNQMWVVHSIDGDQFPRGDLRGDLVRHCAAPPLAEETLSDLEDRCPEGLQREVLRRIVDRGYRRLRVEHPVGEFRIDLVVEGANGKRLAIECDGEKWHGAERWHQDRSRQTVLERAGWRFVRIRGSAFYRDRAESLEPLWDRLTQLGILPGDELPTSEPSPTELVTPQRLTEPPVRSQSVPLPPPLTAPLAPVEGQMGHEFTFAPPSPQAVPIAPARHAPADSLRRPAPMEPERHAVLFADVTQTPLVFMVEETRASSTASEDTLRSPTIATNGRLIADYQRRAIGPLADAVTSDANTVIDGLVEIVKAEGPMLAGFAYQAYVKAAGGQRVGKEIRQALNRATAKAVRDKRLMQFDDSIAGQIDKTLYIPGSSSIVARTLGPRTLHEVPPSELQHVIRLLRRSTSESALPRAVLDLYGLTRLTPAVTERLQACDAYRWEPAPGQIVD